MILHTKKFRKNNLDFRMYLYQSYEIIPSIFQPAAAHPIA